MPGPRTISGSYSHHPLELLCKPKELVERELHLQVLGQEPRLGDLLLYCGSLRPSEALGSLQRPLRFSEALRGLASNLGGWRLLEAPPIVLFKILQESGNLGRQLENRKRIKLGGCLRKQGVGRINQHTNSWFVGHERCALARYAARQICRSPTGLGVSGAISTCYLQPPRSKTP